MRRLDERKRKSPPLSTTRDAVLTILTMLSGAVQPLFLVEGTSDLKHIGMAVVTLGSALVASAVIVRRAWRGAPRQTIKRKLRIAYVEALEGCPLNPDAPPRSQNA